VKAPAGNGSAVPARASAISGHGSGNAGEPHDWLQGATNLQLPRRENHRGGEKPRGWNAKFTQRCVNSEGGSTELLGVDAREASVKGEGPVAHRPMARHGETQERRSVTSFSKERTLWADPGCEEAQKASRPGGRVHRSQTRCCRRRVPRGQVRKRTRPRRKRERPTTRNAQPGRFKLGGNTKPPSHLEGPANDVL